jgi:hypothetical protein
VPFPPWTGILEAYALPFASDPFAGEAPARWLVEFGRGWHHACPSLLSILSGPGCFRRSSRWRVLVVFAGSGPPRCCRQPAAGVASPLDETGLPDLAPWRFLGRQPADSAALGIPQKSDPTTEGRRREVGQGATPPSGAGQGLAAPPYGAPAPGPLHLCFGLCLVSEKIGTSAFVSSNSENISCVAFLKHKNSRKQGTGTVASR